MLGTRVKMTTTASGTGNLGSLTSVTGFQTLDSVFDNDTDGLAGRFWYFIVDSTANTWEYGVGYLSTSTTLVREHVVRSTNSDAAVNFAANTKDIFVEHGENGASASLGYVESNQPFLSSHQIGASSNGNLIADRLYLAPYLVNFANQVDAISCYFNTVSGSSTAIMGIYECIDGVPDNLILETSTFTPAVNQNTQTFTAMKLRPGWYFMALLVDTADQCRAKGNTYNLTNPIGDPGNFGLNGVGWSTNITSGWTNLPATPSTLSRTQNSFVPTFTLTTV